MYIVKKVSMIPRAYPIKAKLKQGSSISEKLLIIGFFLKACSISYFKQKDIKKPGNTISPSPTILQATVYYSFIYGKDILIGRSTFFATVTMTSVPQTQKISQKNKAQSKNRPVLVVLKLIVLRATIEKSTPKMLFKAQCLVAKYIATGIAARIRQIILAFESSNFLHQSNYCKKPGIFQDPIIFCIYSGNEKTYVAMPEIESTIVTEKQAFSIPMKTSVGTTLQRQQSPNRQTDATIGNFLASCILITAQFSSRDLLKLQIVPSAFLDKRVEKIHPIQTQAHVLRSSCTKVGSKRRPPAMFVASRTMQAGKRLRIGSRGVVMIQQNCILL